MATTQARSPKICLVGVGRFGREHLRELLDLEKEGAIQLTAVVVSSDASRDELSRQLSAPVYRSLTAELLATVDAVDIVTPSDTHAQLVRQALPHCHVLVEKPLSCDVNEAEAIRGEFADSDKILMVAHNYRFNPVIEGLRDTLARYAAEPRLVEITMLNAADAAREHLSPNLEFIHGFDIMDFLFPGQEATVISGKRIGTRSEISVRYGQNLHCVINLGWHDRPTTRKLTVHSADSTVDCDLASNTITVRHDHRMEKMNFAAERVSLKRTLATFVNVIAGREKNPVPPDVAIRSLRVAERSLPNMVRSRPRVAVVGGGVFGANCALELAESCDVTLFERNADFMQETSFANQWRHHSGFHYPRSYDTIQEIRGARASFEAHYGDAILRDYPAYYCPSATGIEIPAERYVAACSSNYLSFRFEYPPPDVVNHRAIALSLRTDEGVYDFECLREIIRARLAAAKAVDVRLSTEVVTGELLPDGTKRLVVRQKEQEATQDFDYLINATYSNRNLLAKWFSYPIEPLRFDLYEMLLLRVGIEQVCATVLDGPFTSLVGIGRDNLFLLSHIHDSVLKSDVTEDGLPPDWGEIVSNRANMLRSAAVYFPALEDAEVVESRFATRAVNAFARDFDARPTVIRNHGFGSWSVLGGKIITSVSNAREMAEAIR